MSKNVNKIDLIKEVSNVVDVPQATVKKIVDAMWDTITAQLVKGDPVSIAGFGNFLVKDRAARMGRNPKTGESIQIAASKNPTFKPSKLLKDMLKDS
jgi:DNA-binding protein HU-beta